RLTFSSRYLSFSVNLTLHWVLRGEREIGFKRIGAADERRYTRIAQHVLPACTCVYLRRLFSGQDFVKLLQLGFELRHLRLLRSIRAIRIRFADAALLFVVAEHLYLAFETGAQVFQLPTLVRVLRRTKTLFVALDFALHHLLLVLIRRAAIARIVETLRGAAQNRALRLETVHHDLHALNGKRGDGEILAQLPNLGEQGLGELVVGRGILCEYRNREHKQQECAIHASILLL